LIQPILLSCLFSMSSKPPVTDSPWFWVLMFSLIGIAAIVAIGGQYGKRQARLERQYQARERIAENAVGDKERQEYSSADDTLIPLWPLAIGLGAVAVGAGGMLWRERNSLKGEAAP
jgi:hypothetical protein